MSTRPERNTENSREKKSEEELFQEYKTADSKTRKAIDNLGNNIFKKRLEKENKESAQTSKVADVEESLEINSEDNQEENTEDSQETNTEEINKEEADIEESQKAYTEESQEAYTEEENPENSQEVYTDTETEENVQAFTEEASLELKIQSEQVYTNEYSIEEEYHSKK